MPHIIPSTGPFVACLASIGLGIGALQTPSWSVAADTFSAVPERRFLLLNAPSRPTTYDECRVFAAEFAAEIARLDEQHLVCLDGLADEASGLDAGCAKSSCEALHRARDSASRKSRAETTLCSERVADHLAESGQVEADSLEVPADTGSPRKPPGRYREIERVSGPQDASTEKARQARDEQEQTDYVALVETLKARKNASLFMRQFPTNPFAAATQAGHDSRTVGGTSAAGLDAGHLVRLGDANPFAPADAVAADSARARQDSAAPANPQSTVNPGCGTHANGRERLQCPHEKPAKNLSTPSPHRHTIPKTRRSM